MIRISDLARAAVVIGWCLGTLAGPVAAQTGDADPNDGPYRLVVGDVVAVNILGEGDGWESRVDLDGVLRIPGIGRLQATGKTLDEMEESLMDAVQTRDLYLAPNLSIGIVAYAPVIVTGAVRDPGAFDFRPNLTAAAAAGLAGGASLSEIDGNQMALTSAQLMGDVRTIETDIQQTAIRLARIEAHLDGRETFDLDMATLPITAPDPDLVAHLMDRERAILAEETTGDAQLLALRRTEMNETDNQIEFLVRRRAVQERLSGLQAEAREAAEALDSRGLRTRRDMARIDQSEADTESRLLEIDAALSQARTRKADIARALTQYQIDRRVALLDASALQRTELRQLIQRRRIALEKSFVIGNPSAAVFADAETPVVAYRLSRNRDGKVTTVTVDGNTLLRPGDLLDVGMVLDGGTASPDERG